MELIIGSVHSILIGKSSKFTQSGIYSAINKKPVFRSAFVDVNGIEGDEQGDLQWHGGRDKAIHVYAFEHYSQWRRELGNFPLLNSPGAFGENISTSGITEDNLHIGDRLRIGSVLLEVSQGRQPCWKLNDYSNVQDMACRVQDTLRTGFYCRVIEPGLINRGDDIFLVSRTESIYSLKEFMRIIFNKILDRNALEKSLELPLVESNRKLIEKRLQTRRVEDWTNRILGPQRYE